MSLGLMIFVGVLLASSRRLIFSGTVAASLVNWEQYVCCQVRANEINSEAKRWFSVIKMDDFMNTQSDKWWSTLNLV